MVVNEKQLKAAALVLLKSQDVDVYGCPGDELEAMIGNAEADVEAVLQSLGIEVE